MVAGGLGWTDALARMVQTRVSDPLLDNEVNERVAEFAKLVDELKQRTQTVRGVLCVMQRGCCVLRSQLIRLNADCHQVSEETAGVLCKGGVLGAVAGDGRLGAKHYCAGRYDLCDYAREKKKN